MDTQKQKCKWCAEGNEPKVLDKDGTLISITGLPGTLCHAYEDSWWPCLRYGVELHTVPAAALDAAQGQDMDALAADVLEMCKLRGWSLRWTERGAYLHLEASELIEAIRGKHGDPLREAADVLLVLMSITENAGIPFSAVVEATRATTAKLKTKPHYAGEEFAPPEKG